MSYKITITSAIDPAQRCEEFRGPGCRRIMLARYNDLVAVASQSDIREIVVLGTVGNKLDTVLHWSAAAVIKDAADD